MAECLDISEVEDYHHVKSEDNIADLGTRCDATAADLGPDSDWQHPWWISRPVSEWPTTQDIGKTEVPEEEIVRQKFCGVVQAFESPVDFQSASVSPISLSLTYSQDCLNCLIRGKSRTAGSQLIA